MKTLGLRLLMMLSVLLSVPGVLQAESMEYIKNIKDMMMLKGVPNRFKVDGLHYSSGDVIFQSYTNGRSLFMFLFNGQVVSLSGGEDQMQGSRYALQIDRMIFANSTDIQLKQVNAMGRCVLDLRELDGSFEMLRCAATGKKHTVEIEMRGDDAPIKVLIRDGEEVSEDDSTGDGTI